VKHSTQVINLFYVTSCNITFLGYAKKVDTGEIFYRQVCDGSTFVPSRQ
jgi:hypothetical protein